ncbi:26S proteasome regulatory subunit [Irineochytrium annulatum]|nr:26S proteasome regulatory subunit [Irineochytrium annulatum]
MGIERRDMEIDRDVSQFLQKSRSAAPAELRDFFSKFEELYDKKLWHQLTLVIFEFVRVPASAPFLVPLHDEFIVDWLKKMNQLSLIQYVSIATRTIADAPKALAFVQAHIDRLRDQPAHQDAYTLALCESARLKLASGDLPACKADLDLAEKGLEEPGVQFGEPAIPSNFYRVAADYHKAKADFPKYYKNALLFLSTVDVADLGAPERMERGYDLAISALLGEGIYNFGELLRDVTKLQFPQIMHQILDSLQGTPADWLRQLLLCFNRGDNDMFERISKSTEFLKTPLLVSNLPFLNQKLCLMALMELIFKRDKVERSCLSFQVVSKDTRVPVDEVEHLIMKALSLGLIKGSIDEIERTVSITWVQPRVLDMAQLASVRDRLTAWSLNVKEKVNRLETEEGADEVFIKQL